MVLAKPRRHRGFSLVELLVVIAIIALLVSLLVVGAFQALRKAREAAVKIEVMGLARALEAYKQQYGSYPPDFSDPAGSDRGQRIRTQIRRHVNRNFRYQFYNERPSNQFPEDIPSAERLATLDPAESLYFWLRGYSPVAKYPLGGKNPQQFSGTPLIVQSPAGTGWVLNDLADWTPLYDFDQTQFQDSDRDGWPEYVPKNVSGAPVVYYRHNYQNASRWSFSDPAVNPNRVGFQFPLLYFSDSVNRRADGIPLNTAGEVSYAEPNKFQLISAGLDGLFGNGGGSYPSGIGYDPDELDNVTSFTSGNTLKDDLP